MIHDSTFWTGVLAGLLLGAGTVGHALRLVTLWPWGPLHQWSGRTHIAWAACWLYTLAVVQVVAGNHLGHWIAIVGPVLGISGVLVSGAKVDAFQITMGVGQFCALVIAIALLVT